MKKILGRVFVLLILSSFLVGCGNGSEINRLRTENEQLMKQIQDIMAEQTSIFNDDTEKIAESETTEKVIEETTKKKLTKREKYERYSKKIKVKVYDKKNLPVDYDLGRYSEFIEIDVKVNNGSKKDIKGIKGTLKIYDQFEDYIMSIDWDVSEGVIKAGDKIEITNQGVEYNQFMDTHNKLYSLDYDDIIFEYEIEQVNFADGYKLKL